MRNLQVGPNDAGQRLDRFLAKALPALPAGLCSKFIRTKYIKLNVIYMFCIISEKIFSTVLGCRKILKILILEIQ